MSYTRTRSEGGHEDFVSVLHYRWVNNAWSYQGIGATWPLRYAYKEMSDVVVDNFSERIARGEVINNPMTSTKTVVSSGPYDRIFYGADGKPTDKYTNCAFRWDAPLTMPDEGTFIDRGLNSASSAAWENLNAATWQSLVFLKEIRETLNLGKSVLASAIGCLSGAQKAANVANFYNGYLYGAMPLVGETKNIASAIANSTFNKFPKRETARGVASWSLSTTQNVATFGSAGGTHYVDIRCDANYTLRAYIIYEMLRKDGFACFDRAFGIRLSDLISQLYNMTAYSFVLDWFTNTGAMIATLNPVPPGSNIMASGYTLETDYRWNVQNRDSGSYPPTSPDACNGFQKRKLRSSSLPQPHWSLRPDVFDASGLLGQAQHIANGLFLVAGRLPRP